MRNNQMNRVKISMRGSYPESWSLVTACSALAAW